MKKRRKTGQAYFTYKGKLRPARQMKPLLENCRSNCKNVDEAYRQQMFDIFWSLENYSSKILFLNKLINISETKRSRRKCKNKGSPSRRQFSYSYNLGNGHPICKKCFLRTFDITDSLIRSVILKSFESGIPTDNRGRTQKIRVKKEKLEERFEEKFVEIINNDDIDSSDNSSS